MKKTEFINGLTRAIGSAKLSLKQHSPEILVVAGVVGVVASAVMACKATTRVDEIIDYTKDRVEKIHEIEEKYKEPTEVVTSVDEETGEPIETKIVHYTEEDRNKDLAITYVQSGVKFAKLYGPSILLGALSITCILAGTNILRKRNVALAAAYSALDKGFKEYRSRVIDRIGEEAERDLRYNIKAQTIEETVIDEETGEEKIVEKTVRTLDPALGFSPYAVIFDEASVCWEKDAEYNFNFLRREQNYANDMLRSRGHVYLNDILERLGLPKTPAGQIVGWVYDAQNPNGNNYIDFGICDMTDERKRAFFEGHERCIILDFNVDGNIWELMETRTYAHCFGRK